jgi:hypothetical protein
MIGNKCVSLLPKEKLYCKQKTENGKNTGKKLFEEYDLEYTYKKYS